MEERKLIKSGPGSYVVTIPIQWIRKNNLKKGSIIYTNKTSNNTIIVSPKATEIRAERREATINCKGLINDEITDRIVSCYLNNVNSILFIKINFEQIKLIKKFINTLIGMEIMQETSQKILINDILDLKKISMKNTIRRIDMMIKSIFDDLEKVFIEEKNIQYFDYVDLNILGQCFFARKILKVSLKDPNILQIIRFTIEDVMDNFRMIIEFESIANSLERIIKTLKKAKQDKIIKLISIIKKYYNKSIEAFYNYDRNIAIDIFKDKPNINNAIKELILDNKSKYCLDLYNEFIIIKKSCVIIARIAYDRWKV